MSTISLSGNDTLTLAGRVMRDFADGDFADVQFPNEIVKVKTGKNGNSIFAADATGAQVDLKVRLIRGSPDDKFCNGIVSDFRRDSAGFILLNSTFVKRAGDGRGNITHDTGVLFDGVPTRSPGSKGNAEGDTEQSVVVYEFKFTNNRRAVL